MNITSTSASIANSDPDAAIFNAWNRRQAASRDYNALPFADYEDCHGAYTPEEQAVLDIIDAAEEEIRSSIAATPQGIALQLWVALHALVTQRDDNRAANEADLEYFEHKGEEADWNVRMIVAAIRSLQNMEA